jgi:hypothetical protein
MIISIAASASITFQNVDAILQSQEHIQCHPSLWKHVYSPTRLASADPNVNKIYSCITTEGTIISRKPHADGDTHIWVKLDPGYAKKYLTKASYGLPDTSSTYLGPTISPFLIHGKTYSGLLIAEPICQHKVTLKIAMASCIHTKGTYLHKIVIPPNGSHVCITGSWVTDDQHKGPYSKGWAEIHPVSNIHMVKPTGKC